MILGNFSLLQAWLSSGQGTTIDMYQGLVVWHTHIWFNATIATLLFTQDMCNVHHACHVQMDRNVKSKKIICSSSLSLPLSASVFPPKVCYYSWVLVIHVLLLSFLLYLFHLFCPALTQSHLYLQFVLQYSCRCEIKTLLTRWMPRWMPMSLICLYWVHTCTCMFTDQWSRDSALMLFKLSWQQAIFAGILLNTYVTLWPLTFDIQNLTRSFSDAPSTRSKFG